MYDSNDIAEKIKYLAKTSQIPIKELLDNVGLGRNTMANFKTSMPKADNLARIADYLGCSVDYLLGRSEIEQVGGELGEHEKKLVHAYSAADEGTRQAIDKLLDLIQK